MITRRVIILFPGHALGTRLVEILLPRYEPAVLVLSAQNQRVFERLNRERDSRIEVIHLRGEANSYREAQHGTLDKALSGIWGVVNVMGRDWLSMRVEGEGTAWNIDRSSRINRKIALAEEIMQLLEGRGPITWINLASGQHKPSPEGALFCNTRYGLTGYLKAVELSPRLHNVQVVNICMSYFGLPDKQRKQLHCSQCVSLELATGKLAKAADGDLVAAVMHAVSPHRAEEAPRSRAEH